MSESASSAIQVRDRTPAAIRADNLIRQKLRIGDPNNALEVAEGLKRMFPKGAGALLSETNGMAPLPSHHANGHVRTPESLATSGELELALANVERDLAALTGDHRLKGITAELRGWAQAIRSIVADGGAAARLSLDPRARDRLFAARRQLGDYARLARMIGALTQTMNASYRHLAQSLDSVSSALFVLAGEVMAAMGLGGGRFLLSVPASELQARRDAVLLALRTLAGTTDQAHGNDQWPWGLHGLREILRVIEVSGHLDLRALLEEPTLGKLMDELIERAAQHNIAGLRALGATAEVAVERLHRLMHIVDGRVQPAVPAVTTFLKAIQLFLDAFTASRAGYRLLFIARAPIGFYGLSGVGGPDGATERLLHLVIARGKLAQLLDFYLGCESCIDDVVCQIVLDKLLYDTDRAIDLYALGADPSGNGEPEQRAAAYAYLINVVLAGGTQIQQGTQTVRANCFDATCSPAAARIRDTLVDVRNLLMQALAPPTVVDPKLLTSELCMQRTGERRLESLIATLAPGSVSGDIVVTTIETLLQTAIMVIEPGHTGCAAPDIVPPPPIERSLEVFDRLGQRVLQAESFLGRAFKP